MKNKEQLFAIGLIIVVFAAWLYSRPNCGRGCQTVAGHLLDHGIRDIFLGL